MKIRMQISVSGTFENMTDGCRIGDIVDLPESRAMHYCRLHYATPVVDRKEERALAPGAEERADEPVKRGPGRPPGVVQ